MKQQNLKFIEKLGLKKSSGFGVLALFVVIAGAIL